MQSHFSIYLSIDLIFHTHVQRKPYKAIYKTLGGNRIIRAHLYVFFPQIFSWRGCIVCIKVFFSRIFNILAHAVDCYQQKLY